MQLYHSGFNRRGRTIIRTIQCSFTTDLCDGLVSSDEHAGNIYIVFIYKVVL
jgi:hypothetical protein